MSGSDERPMGLTKAGVLMGARGTLAEDVLQISIITTWIDEVKRLDPEGADPELRLLLYQLLRQGIRSIECGNMEPLAKGELLEMPHSKLCPSDYLVVEKPETFADAAVARCADCHREVSIRARSRVRRVLSASPPVGERY
jgi:hypothetical protein